jgi:hypothetical protein
MGMSPALHVSDAAQDAVHSVRSADYLMHRPAQLVHLDEHVLVS